MNLFYTQESNNIVLTLTVVISQLLSRTYVKGINFLLSTQPLMTRNASDRDFKHVQYISNDT